MSVDVAGIHLTATIVPMSTDPSAIEPLRVTVYCGASNDVDPIYFQAADQLGEALARAGHTLVYGGGSVGLMGRVADSAHAHGGHVHGVITSKLANLELASHTCDELEVVETMRERKQRMEEMADAFIALPGGIGTYEELFEMMAARILDDHRKPIIVVNVRGYFDPMVAMMQRGIDEHFISPGVLGQLLQVASDPEDAVRLLAAPMPALTHTAAQAGDLPLPYRVMKRRTSS